MKLMNEIASERIQIECKYGLGSHSDSMNNSKGNTHKLMLVNGIVNIDYEHTTIKNLVLALK